jgi:hypothetical protein
MKINEGQEEERSYIRVALKISTREENKVIYDY